MALHGEETVTNLYLIGGQTEVMQQEQTVITELLPVENGGYMDLDMSDLDPSIRDAIYGIIQQEDNGANTLLEDGVNLQNFTLDTNDLTLGLGTEADATLPMSGSGTDNINMDQEFINMMYVSPADVCGEKVKSKRGRKRKYPEGQRPRRQRASNKPKVYQLAPIQDPVMEKKRLSALNAKRHRDMQKKEREDLQNQVRKITEERDQLKQLVEKMKRNESTLQVELESFRAMGIDNSWTQAEFL